jgi:hypothetical protein
MMLVNASIIGTSHDSDIRHIARLVSLLIAKGDVTLTQRAALVSHCVVRDDNDNARDDVAIQTPSSSLKRARVTLAGWRCISPTEP